MKSLGKSMLRMLNHFVSTFVLALALLLLAPSPSNAQQLQKGVSVQLAETSNAMPMPDADTDPWIVSVTSTGELYFGIHPVTVERLVEDMKTRPRNREQRLYIKADERTAYSNVKKVLDAGRQVSFEVAALLTAQPEYAAPGAILPPKGLEVMVGASKARPDAPLVQLRKSTRPLPEVKIGQQSVRWSEVQSTLIQLLQIQKEKTVQLQASGQLPFRDVVRVIDICRAAGGKVVLAASEL